MGRWSFFCSYQGEGTEVVGYGGVEEFSLQGGQARGRCPWTHLVSLSRLV
jgi:hypothetical protein